LAQPREIRGIDEDDPVDPGVPSVFDLRQLGVSTRERIDLIVVADVRKRAQLVEEDAVPRGPEKSDMASLGSG
jgi:hypothetical protein